MELREILSRIGADFRVEAKKPLKNNPLAEFIRESTPQVLQEALGDEFEALVAHGSPGQGNWAEVPWVACFYPLVTSSATQGYYVVYLFHAKKNLVSLSLNQGTTAVQNEFGPRKALGVLRERAAIIRSRVADFAEQFDTRPIELGSKRDLPRGYEAGHAFGRTYQLDALPTEASLIEDLRTICRAYVALQYRGGLDPSLESSSNSQLTDERPTATTVEEVKRYRTHQRIERNPKAAKLAKRGRRAVCQVCSFDFASFYGDLGNGYIEAHHLLPLSQLSEGQAVSYGPNDFALLCSNCHRMIHRLDDPSDIHQLKTLVESNQLLD